jgi:hypothetical protein
MRTGPGARIVAGHSVGAILEGALIAALAALLFMALSPVSRPAAEFGGTGKAMAAKPSSGHITVGTPVAYGETTIATVNPGGSNHYVLLKCYTPDLTGTLVYGGYFAVNADKQAVLGPFSSYHWTGGGATCTAAEGYFLRDGLGKWVVEASTTFSVTP